jgi:deoxyribonuclease V
LLIKNLHGWDVSPSEAVKIQLDLADKVLRSGRLERANLVAGIDVSFPNRGTARAAIVVLEYPDLKVIEEVTADVLASFPYVPGLLSFREGPAIVAALGKLKSEPDLFIFDGQGIAHPRRIGIASHMGLFLDKPTIGIAKSKLVGHISGDDLIDRGEVIAQVAHGWPNMRGGRGTQSVFISSGHKLSTAEAFKWARPEPTIAAHKLAAKLDT